MNGSRRDGIFLFAAWLLTQICWYMNTGGIFQQEEAIVYTHITDSLSKGQWDISSHFWLYAGYIGPLLLLKVIGLSYVWMYPLQLGLSLVSLIAFYKLLKTLQVKSTYILWGSMLYVTCPFIQNWNVYLYTDACFSHGVVILMYLLARETQKDFKSFYLITSLLFFLSFTRPIGFLLFPISIIFYFYKNKTFRQISVLTIFFLGMAGLVIYFMSTGKDFYYANHNLETNIICGLPSQLQAFEVNPFKNGMSPVTYLITNPELTIRLFGSRLIKSLWMTRPYFSAEHNLAIVFTLIVYYLPALSGLFISLRKKKDTYYPFISGILILLIPNMLLCADWHNRFMAPILPFILVFTALGLQTGGEMLKKPQVGMDSPSN